MAKGLGSTLTKIPTSSITDSSIGITSMATSGSASSSTYLHGDLSWASVTINGKINTAGSDPVSNTAGDIWYTGGKFKFTTNQTLNSVWSSANSCSSGCTKTVGCGTQAAGLKFGGETPPGTGVIALTLSLTSSKSTSPTILSATLFIPTSIIIESFFTQSPLTKFATPTATIKISAF